MRNLKKVLVMVLALAMMLSIMVVGAGAVPEAFTDAKDIDGAHSEAVEMATQLNIIEGFPDKSFQPKGDVTRAQIAKMICIAINGGEVPATAVKENPSFPDIDNHWAEGFIEYCVAKGIVAGYDDGKFHPDDNVTGAEAAKMMLVALGYNADVEKYVGPDWDLYVNVQANQDGLYVNLLDVENLTTAKLSREHTAQMVWNMLQAYTIKKGSSIDRSDGSVTDNYSKSDTTMFWESYRGIYMTGTLLGFKHSDGAWKYKIEVDPYWGSSIGGAQNDFRNGGVIEVKSSNDYTAWIGHSVNVAFNADDANAAFKSANKTAYGIFHDEGTTLDPFLFGDLDKLNASDDVVKINGTNYRMDEGSVSKLPVYFFTNYNNADGYDDYRLSNRIPSGYDANGDPTGWTQMTLWDYAGKDNNGNNEYFYDHQKFCAVDQDDNGKIDFLLVQPYAVAQVTNVNGSKISMNVLVNEFGGVIDKEFLEDVDAYDGIQRDDWVVVNWDLFTLNDKTVLTKADTISGEISKANNRLPKDSAQFTMDGTQYTFSYPFDTTMGTTYDLCKVGNTLNNAVVVNNYIFAVDTVKKAAITDYALVTKLGTDDKDGDWAKVLFYNSKSTSTVATAAGVSVDPVFGAYIDANGNGKYDSDKDIFEGTLVIYARNSDGDYIFTRAQVGNNDYRVDGSVTGSDVQNNNKTTVGFLYGEGWVGDDYGSFKATVNNDAVIFVRYQKDSDIVNGTYSYKVINGAQLKLNDAEEIADNDEINSLIIGSTIKNVNYVELAYVNVVPGLEDSETLYGYVQDGDNGMETSNTRGDTVKGLDLWTTDADGNVGFKHLQFAGRIQALDADGEDISDWDTKYTSIDAGTLIAYKVNDDGDISQILGFYDVDDALSTWNSKITVLTGAISSQSPFSIAQSGYYDDDADEYVIYGYSDPADAISKASNRFFDFDDAVTMYIDNTDQKGVDSGSVYTANKTGSMLVNNALIVFNANNASVALLVVDVENDINEGRPVMNTQD